MRPVDRGAHPVRPNVREQGDLKVMVPDYSYWRPHLVRRLGEYCSYCEVPLGVKLAVEHKDPKRNPGVDPEAWSNLLLACTNCNSRKRDKRSWEGDITSWAMFPDNKLYQRSDLTFSKEKRTKTQLREWGLLEKGKAADDDKQKCDFVWVEAKAKSAHRERLERMIRLAGLNAFSLADADPKQSDRRVRNRTLAWDRATRLAQLLRDNDEPDILEQIRQTAIATGFWSVWVTVFESELPKSAGRNKQLEYLFGAQTFPGTRASFV
jgi:hypothetical protein